MLSVSVVVHSDDRKMFSAPEGYSERASFQTPTVEMTQCARVLAAWYPQKKPGLASHGTKDGDRRIVEAGRPLTKLQGW